MGGSDNAYVLRSVVEEEGSRDGLCTAASGPCFFFLIFVFSLKKGKKRKFLVSFILVNKGRIRGTLFLPPGPGPFPAVINMYGGIHKKNVIEDKSAMFASRGFASLALAFFGVEGLPKTYTKYVFFETLKGSIIN